MKFIANSTHILSIFFYSVVLFYATPSHAQFINKKWGVNTMITPSKKEIKVSWAVSEKEKRQGLSGLKSEAMKEDEGLLFVYRRMMPLKFWMPNTFFDLDIIFLDKNFKVVAIETLPHYPGRENPKKIPITKPYQSQFVLELHAGMAKKLKITKGSQLKWKKALSQKFLNSLGIE
ncbi:MULTISPECIES: DUF192 domain-containing protein [Halobacteriovorax]|uniref:DUF192 domain-containing protein n=1 Tax=Halobacteriovorax vibrionivorans TaxID=2152716 RepID=A0ABY0IK51_9BACT|nr:MULTISPECIES: DUF192 domain-containing protein [Halobacteriovorax]RZF22503.1 DUF192 domain-containing protein [Halobacteriovorax vibrionivorans]TGD47695.1 DUF192 domain-containing protein [Halobacteriovorax sp. Y22]